MTIRTWLAVEPLDTVIARDGRSFEAGATYQSHSRMPQPSTLGGVVGRACGRRIGGRIIGPVAAVDAAVRFPAPADIVFDDKANRYRRLAIVERPNNVITDLDSHRRLEYMLEGAGDPNGRWISRQGMRRWLHNEPPIRAGQPLGDEARRALTEHPWSDEQRIGLAQTWTGEYAGTAEPSLLYSATHLRPRPGLRFLVACDDAEPITVPDGTVAPLGGRSRVATVQTVTLDQDPFPEPPDDFPDHKVAVYIATPALVSDVLWSPAGAKLCALAVTGAEPVPVASVRAGRQKRANGGSVGYGNTRRLYWAVPAGSVYFLQFNDAAAARDWARAHHGCLLPGQLDEADSLVTAGFGTCLIGKW